MKKPADAYAMITVIHYTERTETVWTIEHFFLRAPNSRFRE